MEIYFYLFNLFLLVHQVFANKAKLLEDFVLANRIFTADVYRDLSKRTCGNILICPLSAELLLGLLRFGAKGNTAKELALYIHNSDEEVRNMFIQINKKLYSNDKYMLTSANNIFLNNKYSINNVFEGIAYGDFKTGVQNLDFLRPDEAVLYINTWVEKRTRHKIKNMITIEQVPRDTSAILINTMYFRGNWINQFDRRNTLTKKFYISEKETVDTEMLSIDSYFNYYDSKELDAQFLEMGFDGDDVGLTIVLPRERLGLEKLENSISDVLAPNTYKSVQIEVYIPKFTIESQIDFKPILINMGVREPFSNKADFTEISSSSPLVINQIIQKTFFEINEKGATSAPSTAVVCTPLTLPQEVFNANHPFLFFLKHKTNGYIFIGKYVAPPQEKANNT